MFLPKNYIKCVIELQINNRNTGLKNSKPLSMSYLFRCELQSKCFKTLNLLFIFYQFGFIRSFGNKKIKMGPRN